MNLKKMIKRLFCKHQWVLGEYRYDVYMEDDFQNDILIKRAYEIECKKCGKIIIRYKHFKKQIK